MQRYHEIPNEAEFTPKQRNAYFQLGAEVDSSKQARLRFAVDPNYSHEIALAALVAADWKLGVARAILTATRKW